MPVVKRYETGPYSVFEIWIWISSHMYYIYETVLTSQKWWKPKFYNRPFLISFWYRLIILRETYFKNILMLSHSEVSEENSLKSENKRYNFDETPIKCLIFWVVSWGFVIFVDSWSRNTNSADWLSGLWRCHPLHVHPGVQGAAGSRCNSRQLLARHQGTGRCSTWPCGDNADSSGSSWFWCLIAALFCRM